MMSLIVPFEYLTAHDTEFDERSMPKVGALNKCSEMHESQNVVVRTTVKTHESRKRNIVVAITACVASDEEKSRWVRYDQCRKARVSFCQKLGSG